MKYRLKPRFYVITITAGLLVSGLAINHIDATCAEKIETRQVITPVYAAEVIEEPAEPVSLGEFTITHYCRENYPHICNDGDATHTATGTTPTPGRTIAVDPEVIPYGTEVIINGKTYIAEDTGGAINGNRIDIVTETHEEALRLGIITAEVYVEE